uniref:Acyl-coenzyme A oxidase n=1 Tax=Phallusia mammillata TaxID=59560 RepID=A0A6F9D4Y1_9ASCI|nr:peroxisomal acyl-coenzyme A oxidase 2 [Phallusia mammillata]
MSHLCIESQLLSKERQNVTFPIEELTNIWDGGREETMIRRRVEKLFADDPELKSPPLCTMTRDEEFTEATRKSAYIYRHFIPKHKLYPSSRESKHLTRAQPLATNLFIHMGVFVYCIKTMGSDKQVAKWLQLAKNLNIIGTYAQTELGHGSFLRGLETQATYDRTTQEFVINCPQLSSMKWWPGDLGVNANHALVMANLIIDNKKYGMHAFIVQIRDLSTHKPLPGVSVGDIGNKFGLGSTDNGFLYLKNVRIPLENLLNKNAEVKPDGTYLKKASDRLVYGSMVNLRVSIPKQCTDVLAKACTIAIRYSGVRRQGLLKPDGAEVPILDYTLQQHKLIPQLATVYATNFAGLQIQKKYEVFLQNLSNDDISDLAELHALSASFKASVSEQGTEGVEVCRRACGGHGYSQASGLPSLLARVTPACTYEGENTVLYLQTARFLMKCASKKAKDLPKSVTFLVQPTQMMNINNVTSLDFIVHCFKSRATICVQAAAKRLQQTMGQGVEINEAWNKNAVELVKAAKAYVMQFIVDGFTTFVKGLKCSKPTKKIFEDLCSLYGLHFINNNSGDFLKLGIITAHHCNLAEEAEIELLGKLRPNAVGIVDAFDFSDFSLDSCLGAYDGNVYERLFDMAKLSPLNKEQVHQASYKYLRPYLLEGRDILEGSKSKL